MCVCVCVCKDVCNKWNWLIFIAMLISLNTARLRLDAFTLLSTFKKITRKFCLCCQWFYKRRFYNMKHGKRITTQLPYTCIYKHKHMNTKEIASSSEHFRNTVFLLLKKKYIWKKKKKKKEKKKQELLKCSHSRISSILFWLWTQICLRPGHNEMKLGKLCEIISGSLVSSSDKKEILLGRISEIPSTILIKGHYHSTNCPNYWTHSLFSLCNCQKRFGRSILHPFFQKCHPSHLERFTIEWKFEFCQNKFIVSSS